MIIIRNFFHHCQPLQYIVLATICLYFAGCSTAPRYTRSTPKHSVPPKKSTKNVNHIVGVKRIPAPAAQQDNRNNEQSDEQASMPDNTWVETGQASYYARHFQGHKTANGERYSNNEFTAAHRTLPFGTVVQVTNTENMKSVVVRINDRGPHTKNRIIDLSYKAAQQLDVIKAGTANVKLEILDKGD